MLNKISDGQWDKLRVTIDNKSAKGAGVYLTLAEVTG